MLDYGTERISPLNTKQYRYKKISLVEVFGSEAYKSSMLGSGSGLLMQEAVFKTGLHMAS